jgi:ubiquinol-cytochrome c reductase cytochrome b subunit
VRPLLDRAGLLSQVALSPLQGHDVAWCRPWLEPAPVLRAGDLLLEDRGCLDGASIIGRVPFIGAYLVHLMLAGLIIAAETLSRFFTLHVFVIPGLIIALVSVHLRLVLTAGINEYPEPWKLVRKETYVAEYETLIQAEGVPFAPSAISKELVFSALVIMGVLVCSVVFGPSGPSGPPDPTQINTAPRPDFYFLSLFALFALLPAYLETFLLLVAPPVALALLFVLPFLSNTGEKNPRRRPVVVLGVMMILLVIGLLAYLGTYSPWSPQMDAWSGVPTPVEYIKGRTPLELQGALVLQNKQCRNCHSLGGEGGRRGPALDGVATHLTRDQLIRQVIQGGGNMPAYGKNLAPHEVTALVAFMQTLRQPHEAVARDATVSAAPSG